MSYAAVMPTFQKIMEDAIIPREKARKAVKADMDRNATGVSKETQPSPAVVDRDQEDKEDAELSEPHQRAIKGFRRFIEESAGAPNGPHLKTLYQHYRFAIRTAGLALEEASEGPKKSLSAALAFHQRQISRGYEAAGILHGAYALCSQEAEKADNGGRIAVTIMAYAAVLEVLKDNIGGTILEEMKKRDQIQAKINKTNK